MSLGMNLGILGGCYDPYFFQNVILLLGHSYTHSCVVAITFGSKQLLYGTILISFTDLNAH